MFVDSIVLTLQAGRGGDGAVSFLREAFRPRGGPDGGDGGDGGSVVLTVASGRNSLNDLASRRTYKAEPGQPGGTRNCNGRKGKDVVLEVPPGTLVYRNADETLVCDLTEPGETFVVCQGGKGGRGNTAFAHALNQAPRSAEKGTAGQEGKFRLELKLIAEVGLVGLPNAGKSTFLSRVTRATPRVAAYPFTTLHPHLGVARLGEGRDLVLADIPGLIEGASDGKGLGQEFLRHVERTGLLLHLIDGAAPEVGGPEPLEAYRTIRAELESYTEGGLGTKPEVVALNKIDALEPAEAERRADALSEAIGKPVHRISGVSGAGCQALLELLERERATTGEDPSAVP